MRHRRVLSIWFPHLGAERVLRAHRGRITQPFAVIADNHNLQTLNSLSPLASTQGLSVGQSLSDARAICPDLLTALQDKPADQAFIAALQRWAGQFSPWVSIQGETGLCLDITGCAHLFGGEEDMIAQLLDQTGILQLTAHVGIADTVGAAWALARFGAQSLSSDRSGDAIEQEARATRSRAFKRRNWERGGARPQPASGNKPSDRIAAPGKTIATLSPLPITALRLPENVATGLARVGLRRIQDLLDLPRDALARRFGADVLRRLDQATGITPEPVSPSQPVVHFATRLSFPDPIGLPEDISAGIQRLIDPLCIKLKTYATGCRKVQLMLMRSDGTHQVIEAGLARATHDPDRIFPLLTLQLPKIEPGYGIDVMRLQAIATEPLSPEQHSGPINALAEAKSRRDGNTAEEDLIGRLGARIGLEQIINLHPADSTIPEKMETERIAAYAGKARDWPKSDLDRPILMFRPEPIKVRKAGDPLTKFTWRRRTFTTDKVSGPERIAPEWWLDDPSWRDGTRDYWKISTQEGLILWVFKTQPNVWSCHGLMG